MGIGAAHALLRVKLARQLASRVKALTHGGESQFLYERVVAGGARTRGILSLRSQRECLFVLNFFAFPLAERSLAMLACQPIDGVSTAGVMVAAPWIPCGSPPWRALVALALVTLCLLCGTLGLVVLALRRAVAKGPAAVAASPAGFLADGLRSQFWWYDVVVVLGRRLGVALMLAVVAQASRPIASMGAFFVLVGGLVIQLRLAPYDQGALNTVETVSVSVCAIALLLGLMLEGTASPTSATVFSAFVVLLVVTATTLYVLQLVLPLRDLWVLTRGATRGDLGVDGTAMLNLEGDNGADDYCDDEYRLFVEKDGGVVAAAAQGASGVAGPVSRTEYEHLLHELGVIRSEIAARAISQHEPQGKHAAALP
eukprot:c16767_g1_i2.p1 GENE.c16767_g1_i2~~c16767_g1_i2.p1  ORF type:complete len:370 (+),score=43.94 c16767_g1_i2:3-1112(+)